MITPLFPPPPLRVGSPASNIFKTAAIQTRVFTEMFAKTFLIPSRTKKIVNDDLISLLNSDINEILGSI